MLAADRLSWTAFTAMWVLWIWGEMEARDFYPPWNRELDILILNRQEPAN